MKRAVFLDRDGVLNEPVLENGRPHPPSGLAELRITPGAAPALQQLREAGFLLVVVTNQPDVARGKTPRETVEAIHAALAAALPLDAFYTCWHDDADGCHCRKPLPGLIVDAAAEREVDLAASWVVGDRWRDVEAGAAADCRTIWIDRGYTERAPDHPTATVANLPEAVRHILDSQDR